MVSAGFCHLLADAERRLHSEGHFPLAPFLCALGFLLTLFADNVAHYLSSKHGVADDHGGCHGRNASIPLAEVAVVGGAAANALGSKPSLTLATNGVSPKTAKVEDVSPFGGADEALTTQAAAGMSEAKPRLPGTHRAMGMASDSYAQLDGAFCD